MQFAEVHKSTYLLPKTEQWWDTINLLIERIINQKMKLEFHADLAVQNAAKDPSLRKPK